MIFLAKPSAILPPANISEKPPSFFIFTVFTIVASYDGEGNHKTVPNPPRALAFASSCFRQLGSRSHAESFPVIQRRLKFLKESRPASGLKNI